MTLLLLIGALAGYLAGSIPFAAIVGRLTEPDADITRTRVALANGPEVEMEGVSATSVSMNIGRRWGFVVAVLDIAKAGLVTLAFRLAFPDEPAYLAAAAFAVVGHIWPVWNRFHGGYGISPMLGGVAVVDPVGLAVTLVLGSILGALRRDFFMMVHGWTLFLIPWFVIFGTIEEVIFAVAIVALYWGRTRRIRRELYKKDESATTAGERTTTASPTRVGGPARTPRILQTRYPPLTHRTPTEIGSNMRSVPLVDAGQEDGGKAAGLSWLIRHGYRVPDGVVVSSAEAPGLDEWVRPGRHYAVRSSASVEDSPTHSFAGQFATELDVIGLERVRAAAQTVVDSAHEERLEPYLRHAGVDPAQVRMSVIVQDMVDAKASGVAFTRNPLTGLADVVIEAVRGTGRELAAGKVTPERWVNHWGAWTEQPETSDIPMSVMEALVGLVAAVADDRDEPVDVEWSWDGSTMFLLQVRSMTETNVPVYSNRLAKEFLPGMVSPLVWSVNVPVVNRAWLGLFASIVGPLDLEPEDLARQFAYRAYFNMGVVGDIFEAMSMPRDLLEVLMGIEGGEDRPTFRPRMSVMQHMPRLTRMAWRIARFHQELDGLIPEAQQELAGLEARDPKAMSDDRLLEQLAELETVVGRLAGANILAPLLFSAYGAILRRRLEKRGIDAHSMDFGAGEAGLGEYDPKLQLERLAREAAQLDEPTRARVLDGELELLPDGEAFLERFGHLSDSGNDFSKVPWREDPTQVAALLAPSEISNGSSDAEANAMPTDLGRVERMLADRTARYRLERERVSYTYARGYGQFRPIVLEIAGRLVDRGLLDERDDVFYLTRAEMEAGLRGDAAGGLRELASERRADTERLADVDMPEIIFGDEFEPVPAADPGQRLTGIPSSRGVRRAVARVVNGVREAGRVEPGDVVVIPYSDVGWTPMLARAGGIVAESGGVLSHSSIVAREFGIPCVVSVSGAMRIPDGSMVRVDGFTGDVQWDTTA